MKMSKFAIMSSLVFALASSGCIFVSDDDDDGVVTDGIFHATWGFTGGETCESVGADTVIYGFTLEGEGTLEQHFFDCDAYAGDSDPLALGTYGYEVYLLDCSQSNDPECLDGEDLGMSPTVKDTFLAADGTAVCDEIDGDFCIVNLAQTIFAVTP